MSDRGIKKRLALPVLILIISTMAIGAGFAWIASTLLSLFEGNMELRSKLDETTLALTNLKAITEELNTKLGRFIEGNKLTIKSYTGAMKFTNKLTEVSHRINEYDVVTARKKISEAKLMLPNLLKEFENVCSFLENNTDLFGSEILSYLNCEGNKEMFKSCYPQMLDSQYNMVGIVEDAKKLEEGKITLEQYKSSCLAFINNYNPIRGTCNSISEKYDLELYFPDLTAICKV